MQQTLQTAPQHPCSPTAPSWTMLLLSLRERRDKLQGNSMLLLASSSDQADAGSGEDCFIPSPPAWHTPPQRVDACKFADTHCFTGTGECEHQSHVCVLREFVLTSRLHRSSSLLRLHLKLHDTYSDRHHRLTHKHPPHHHLRNSTHSIGATSFKTYRKLDSSNPQRLPLLSTLLHIPASTTHVRCFAYLRIQLLHHPFPPCGRHINIKAAQHAAPPVRGRS